MSDRYRLIDNLEIHDHRGRLVIAELDTHIPMPIRRMFVLCDLPPGAIRAGHAHRRDQQWLLMIAGDCRARIYDGKNANEIRLFKSGPSLFLPSMHWLELDQFSDDAACLVLASEKFDEGSYIRDRAEFEALVNRQSGTECP